VALRGIEKVAFVHDPIPAPQLIGDLVHAEAISGGGRHLEHVVDGDSVPVDQVRDGLDVIEAHALQRALFIGRLRGAPDTRRQIVFLRSHVFCVELRQCLQEFSAFDRGNEIFDDGSTRHLSSLLLSRFTSCSSLLTRVAM
jgi:hypothetical protein